MLEEILTKCDFREDGLYLANSGLNVRDVYRFMHEAIADDHLPVYKVCGFNLSSATHGAQVASVTERNISVLENTLEVSYNLTDKVFLGLNSNIVSVTDYAGELNLEVPNNTLKSNAKFPTVVFTNPHILTSVHPVSLKLKVMWGTGFASMSDTSKRLQDTSYFPMAVRYSIHDYCRVCPPMSTEKVDYRLHKNFKPEYVKQHFQMLYGMQHDISKEDMKWLLNYER